MNSVELNKWAREIVSTLSFAWVQLAPGMLHTIHRLVLASSEMTKHIMPPCDVPLKDMVSATSLKPSEMQAHLLSIVVPSFLPSIQAVAEDELVGFYGKSDNACTLVENSVASGAIDRKLAARAHHWRIVRNVVAHGGGVISKRIAQEVVELHAKGTIDFLEFALWGPLLDAGHGGTLVPLIERAVTAPQLPILSNVVKAVDGNRIVVGMGDLLAAADVWSAVVARVCGR